MMVCCRPALLEVRRRPYSTACQLGEKFKDDNYLLYVKPIKEYFWDLLGAQEVKNSVRKTIR